VALLIAGAASCIAADPLAPKLLGIVSTENRKRALLEVKEQSPWGAIVTRKPILAEGERDGTFAVTAIDEKTATVSIQHEAEPLTLRLEQAPGVTAAGLVSSAPFEGGSDNGLIPEGRPLGIQSAISADMRLVTAGYFGAMGIPITAGRDFSAADRAKTLLVAIISKSAAKALSPQAPATASV